MGNSGSFRIRDAKRPTCRVYDCIVRLAEYEQLAHEVVASESDIRDTLFGSHHYAFVLLAEEGTETVGVALFSQLFHVPRRPGLYLEDLYVVPTFRGRVWKALLARLAAIAVDRKCGRMEWNVLSWNEPAIRFYESLQAKHVDEWKTYRLTGAALTALAHP